MKKDKAKHFVLSLFHFFLRCFTCCSTDEDTRVKRSAAAATVKDYSEGADPPAKPGTKPGTKPVNRPVTNSSHSTILRGSKHQGQMYSPYSGNQCTSVALYSLLCHMIMRVDTWVADSIDSILALGTETHEYFREVARLSTNPDKRVALDDFPEDFPINEHYRGRSHALGFGLVRCVDGDTDLQVFPDLKRFLEDCFAQGHTSVVVTVGDFSISVMEHAGCFWLFDSHACDSAGGKSLLGLQEGKACLLSFANLDGLITHIEIHFGSVQYVARAFSFCEADSLCEDETPSHQGPAVEEKMDVSSADMPKDDVSAVEEKVEMAELSKDEDIIQSDTHETTRQYQEFIPFLLNYLRDQTLHLSTQSSPVKTPLSVQKAKKLSTPGAGKTSDKKGKQLFGSSPGDCLVEIENTPESVFSPNVSFDSPVISRKCSSTPLSVNHKKQDGSTRDKKENRRGTHEHRHSPHSYHSPSSDRPRHRLSLGEFIGSPDIDDTHAHKKKSSPFLGNRRDHNVGESGRNSRSAHDNTLSPAPVFSINSVSDFPPMEQPRKSDLEEKVRSMHTLTNMKDSPNFDSTPRQSKQNTITKSRRISFTTLQLDNSPSPPCKAPSRRIKPTPVQTNMTRKQNKAFLDSEQSKSDPHQQNVAFSGSCESDVQVSNGLQQERELLRQERAKRLKDSTLTPPPVTPTKGLERSNSVLETADPSLVTWKDKLDILALVYSLCLQDNLLPNLVVELYFLLQLLTARAVDMDFVSGNESSDINYFSSIHNTVYFSVNVFAKQTCFLKLLDRCTLRLLSENHRVNVFSESLGAWLRQELTQGQNKIGPAFPGSPIGGVSFQAETDNRQNFPNDSSFHLFKKQRDSFYELLREWEANHMNPSWSFVSSLGDRIQSLVSCRAELANHLHFARLFQSQLIAMCKGDSSVQTDGDVENIALLRQLKLSNPEKFKRLQERFIMPLSVGGPCPLPWFPGCQEFFRDFITAANSPIFNQHLIDTFTARITELNGSVFTKVELEETEVSEDSDDEEKGRFVSNLMTLRLLAKFLGFVVFLPYRSASKIPDDMEGTYRSHRGNHCLPVDVAVCLRDGYSHGYLSVTLPWVVEFLSMMDSFAPKIDVIQFLLFILLFLHRLSWKRISDISYVELLLTSCISWLFENCVLPEGFFFSEVPEDVTTFMGDNPEQKQDRLDDMGFVDQKVYYACCPYVGEFKRLLVEFSVGFSSKNSAIRKITPVSADDSTKQSVSQRQIQVQLEENFFHNHPTSLKRTVDFVADRTASNYIKKFRALPLQSAIAESKSKLGEQLQAMASGSPTGKAKGKLQFVIVQLSKEYVQNVRSLSAAEVESYCEKKTAAVLPLLLPDSQSGAVVSMCSQIALRISIDKVQQWMSKHITPALFQGELQLELDRLMKVAMLTEQRMAAGVQQKSVPGSEETFKVIAEVHDFTAPSPSDVLVQLKESVLSTDKENEEQFYQEILQLVRQVLCKRQDVIPAVYKSYGKLTLDLFLELIFNRTEEWVDEVLQNFIEVWKLLKPHIPFSGVVSPRIVYQIKDSVNPQRKWKRFTTLLKHLLHEELLSDKELQQACIGLVQNMENIDESIIQLAETLLELFDEFKDNVNFSEIFSAILEVISPSTPLAEYIKQKCPDVCENLTEEGEISILSDVQEEIVHPTEVFH